MYLTAVCLIGVALLATTAAFVVAEPNGPTSLDVGSTSSRNLSTMPGATANAQGGNVTEINIQTLTITKSWQGYYGNITGQIALQNALNETFYNWSMTSFNGRVFASRASSVAWSTMNCTNATNRTNEETYLNQTSADGDSVTNTFNSTTHPGFTVGTVSINANSCFATYGFVNNASQSTNFPMVLLSPASGVPVYTALTNKSTVGFDGRQHDFQLLVGENERTTLGVTTYYFWTEFN
jgi:hypothetical protein